jgi:hypothetical protein
MKPSTRDRLRYLLLVLTLTIGALPMDCIPGTDEVRRVKAAFVLNITRFVSWPPDAFAGASDPLRLCFYRSNPLGSAIETIRGKKVRGRRLIITTVRNLAQGRECQVLFVPPDALERFSRERRPGNEPILTLTDDTTGSAGTRADRRDIMLTLIRNGTRIGFEIDLALVRRCGLRMSAELLKLARIVDEPSGADSR